MIKCCDMVSLDNGNRGDEGVMLSNVVDVLKNFEYKECGRVEI